MWPCDQCGAEPFTTRHALKSHQRWIHPEGAPPAVAMQQPPATASQVSIPDASPPVVNNVEDSPAAGGGDEGESQDFPQPPPPPPVSAYDELVARLLEFVCHSNAGAGLSEADRRTLLELLTASRECGRLNAKMHPKTTAQLDGLLDDLVDMFPDERWVKKEVRVNVAGCEDLPPLYVYVRNLDEVVKHLVKTLPIKWGFWGYDTVGGKRVFDHPCQGRLYELLEGLVRGGGADALPIQWWSDKVSPFKSGDQSYYPLSLVLLSVPFEEIRKQWPRSHVAFLPALDGNDKAYRHITPELFRFYKAAAHAAVMEAVMFPFCDSTHRIPCVDRGGVQRLVSPTFMFYSADFQEAEAANAMLTQTLSLVTRAPDQSDELRTVESITAALSDMHVGHPGPAKAPTEKQKKESRLQGVKSIMVMLLERSWLCEIPPDVLARAPWLMVPAFFTCPDVLHVWDEGILKYFFQVRRLFGCPALPAGLTPAPRTTEVH